MKERTALQGAGAFAGLTIGLSYLIFWGPIAILKVPTISFVANVRGPLWAIILFLLGGFVPSVVAIVLTRIFEGSKGLSSLLRSALQFKLGYRWYLASICIVLVGASGQIIINSLLGNHFNLSLYISQLPSFIPLIVIGPLSEEFGWRGYLLMKLQQRWNALSSAVAVGVVWGLWHFPLFFMVGTSQHELHLPFIGFLIGTVAVSILMTWVNNNTRNSMWAAIFLHWLYTYVAQVNSSGVTRSMAYNWLEFLPYILMAIVVVVIWKPARLSTNRQSTASTDAG
jgi:membrane protease YdiL (CAAX protease family)